MLNEELWKRAEKGDSEAQIYLFKCYLKGDGVEKDSAEAVRWLTKAAEQGDPEAQNILGICYKEGTGVIPNKTLAIEWLEKAAAQGNIQAKGCLATMYMKDEDIPSDYAKAERYYLDVINSGDEQYLGNSLMFLAHMYAHMLDNYDKAFPFFKRAAEYGITEAKYIIGGCYYEGLGTAKDNQQALYWWRQAAAEGNQQAKEAVPVLERIIHSGNAANTGTSTQKSGGCYVATAVYGSYDCPEVWTLRRYRDDVLAESRFGRAFIHIYYAISPTLVKWFGHTKWFQMLCKKKLDGMVKNLQQAGIQSTPYSDKTYTKKSEK